MAKSALSDMTTEQLQSKLRSLKALQTTVIAIFVVVIATWLVLGLWRSNLPVFITTLAVAIGTSASQLAVRQGLEKELEKRRAP